MIDHNHTTTNPHTGNEYNFGKVLDEGFDNGEEYASDVLQELIEKKWIFRFGTGQWVYGKEMTLLIQSLKDAIRRHVAAPMGFQEWTFPRMLSAEILEKFKTSVYAPDLLFSAKAFSNDKVFGQFMLDPVQCAPLYAALSASPRDSILPLRICEADGGWTYRAESVTDGMLRTYEFMRFEMVYLGSPEYVQQCRREVLKTVSALLTRLNLKFRITVGEPCYHIQKALDMYKAAKTIDDYPVVDFEGYVPSEDRWVEFSGCSNERGRLIKAFDLDFEDTWSGCIGIGLSRLAFIFLSQFGLDIDRWPAELKRNRNPSQPAGKEA